MALTNSDVDGAWTLQSTNTALEGRQMVGGYWAQANTQNSSLNPMQVWRQGVVPSASNASTYYDGVVAPTASPSLSLLVYPATYVVSRASQAVYQVYNVAVRTVTVATADPTNPRLDLIVARAEDSGVGDAATRAQIQVITGTPAAAPVIPALPAGAVPLASARVNALATTITTAQITDLRKSVAVNGAVRRLLAGDLLSDPGFRDGELRDTGTGIDRWTDSSSTWVPVGVPFASATPRGTIARGFRTSSSTSALTSSVLRLDNVAVKSGRLYRVYTNSLKMLGTVAGDTLGLNFSFVSSGTAVTGSPTLPGGLTECKVQNGGGLAASGNVDTTYAPGADQTLSILLYVTRSSGTGNAQVVGDTNNVVIMSVEDVGAAVANTGVAL